MQRTISALALAICVAVIVAAPARSRLPNPTVRRRADIGVQAAERASARVSTHEAEKTAEAPKGPVEPVYSVVSPLGDPTVDMIEMAPRLDTLAGKTVCLVWNHTFKSNITLPAIGESLKKKYPDIKIIPYTEIDAAIRATGGGFPADAATLRAALKEKGCDAVISGNGGCGICTPRTASAVIEAEKLGIPGVVVTGPGFDKQARAVGIDQGVPSLQVAVYPGSFDLHSNAQLQQYSTLFVVPQIIEALTKPIPATETSVERAKEVVFTGSIDEINRYFADCNWSDGLAIVPPTVERIREFLKYTDYSPDEEIAVLPSANLRATPWNIAANGVMAGCRPEHMPVLIAAVKAMGNPAFRLSMTGGSTHSFMHFYLVNGPLAQAASDRSWPGPDRPLDQPGHRPCPGAHRAEHRGLPDQGNPDGHLRQDAILGTGGG